MCGGGLQYSGDRNFGQLEVEMKALPGGAPALGSQHWNELMGNSGYSTGWAMAANTSPGTFGWAKEPGYHASNASGMVPNPRTGGMKPGLLGVASSAGPGAYKEEASESSTPSSGTPAYGAAAPQQAAAARPAAAPAAAPSYGSVAMPWTQMNDYAGGIFSSQKGFMPGGPLSARQSTGASGATPAAAAPGASAGGGGKAAPTTAPGQYASTPKTTTTAPSPGAALGGGYGTALDQMSTAPAASQPQRQVTNRQGGHGSGEMLGYGIPLETRLGQDIAMQRNGAAAWAQKYGYPAPDHIGYWGTDRNGNIGYQFWPGVFANAGGGAIRA